MIGQGVWLIADATVVTGQKIQVVSIGGRIVEASTDIGWDPVMFQLMQSETQRSVGQLENAIRIHGPGSNPGQGGLA